MDTIQKEHNFWLVGGDLRFRALARLLREDGHTVRLSALRGEGLKPEPLGQDLRLAHCVILPLPMTGPDGVSLHTPLWDKSVELFELLDLLDPGQLVCGGMISPEIRTEAVRRKLRLLDYYEREEFKVANAVPTVVAVGLTQKRGTLSESESLVLHTFQEDDSCIQKLAGALVADMLKKGPFRDDIMNVLVDVILGTFLIQPIRIAILYRLFELVERHSISIWYCICHRIGNDRNLVPPEGSADCFYRIILVPGMLLFRVDKNLLVPVNHGIV